MSEVEVTKLFHLSGKRLIGVRSSDVFSGNTAKKFLLQRLVKVGGVIRHPAENVCVRRKNRD